MELKMRVQAGSTSMELLKLDCGSYERVYRNSDKRINEIQGRYAHDQFYLAIEDFGYSLQQVFEELEAEYVTETTPLSDEDWRANEGDRLYDLSKESA